MDLMLATHTRKGKGVPLDVPDFLWLEMYYCVINRKVPTLCPYIMAFLNAKWAKRMPGVPLTSIDKLIVHEPKKLKKKNHPQPRITEDEHEVFADSNDSDFELERRAKPSWAVRLKNKLKKTFCLQVDIQHKMYEAHHDEKLAHHRQIQMMRHMNIEIASGSEKTITPEDKWISTQSQWTDEDDSDRERESTPVFQSTAADDEDEDMDNDDAAEESEEDSEEEVY